MNSSDKPTWGFLIHDVARLARWSFDRQSQDLGLTRAQWSVLAHLNRSNGTQQNLLAQLMDIKPITLGRHIDRLEEKGWLERRDDPCDRRIKRVFLTDSAAPILEAMESVAQKVRKQAMAGIGRQEEGLLIDILTRMRDNLSDQ
ncbi:MAG: MarR family transcriptional regulator [Gammaproteobacteria bacterium]|nr:MarR family transcriptional regulator [Pseudomonadales bacterium]MCP5349001.1 MarR family transcriptional regulator [Pseudomonadales bacterium]